jgi:hypothetical protein
MMITTGIKIAIVLGNIITAMLAIDSAQISIQACWVV